MEDLDAEDVLERIAQYSLLLAEKGGRWPTVIESLGIHYDTVLNMMDVSEDSLELAVKEARKLLCQIELSGVI